MTSHPPISAPTIKFVLCDIEGTTTDIAFVKDTLFPFAATHLPDFIRAHGAREEVREQLRLAASGGGMSADDDEDVIALLLQWIEEDRKATPLKTLQGMIWREGYERGILKGHLYEDAHQVLRHWHTQGIHLGVYSSGSVAAQILLFKYSIFGDLAALFSAHFDTLVGHKRDESSYRAINQSLIERNLISGPSEILFLSDIVEELDAAGAAGMNTAELRRDKLPPSQEHISVHTFDELTPHYHFTQNEKQKSQT